MQEDVEGRGTPASSRSPSPAFRRATYADDDQFLSAQSHNLEQLENSGLQIGTGLFGEASEEDELDSQDSEFEDEDEEEEEFYTTAATLSRYGNEVPGLLTQEQVLPGEEFGEITIRELYSLLKDGTINLNPAYQRESVWTKPRAEDLIDSIFRNVHIPELLFNVYSPEDAQEENGTSSSKGDPDRYKLGGKGKQVGEDIRRFVWNCADGKQRCTSIKRFMDGEISVKPDTGQRREKYTYHQLPAATKAIFDNRKLRFGFYRELSYPQECQIFRRVQLGVVLTANEQEHAVRSDYKLWIDQLVQTYAPQAIEEQCRNPEAFSPRITELGHRNKGLSVFFFLASSLVLGHAKAKHRTPNHRRKELAEDPLPPPASREMIIRILERLKRLSLVPQLPEDETVYKWSSPAVHTPGDPRSRMRFPHRVWRIPQNGKKPSRHLAPVEMQFIPLIIQKFEDRRDGDLLEIIEQLRQLVSAKFPAEIKDNPAVWNCMKSFLDDYDCDTQLKYIYNDDGSRVQNGIRKPSTTTITDPTASGSSEPNGATKKRPFGGNGADIPQPDNADSSSSSTPNKRKKVSKDDTEAAERLAERKRVEEAEKKRVEEAAKAAQLERERIEREREQERLRMEEEARRLREEAELERRRIEAEKVRERRLQEVKKRRLAKEREIAERDQEERRQLEAREKERQEQKEALVRAEKEEIARITNEPWESVVAPSNIEPSSSIQSVEAESHAPAANPTRATPPQRATLESQTAKSPPRSTRKSPSRQPPPSPARNRPPTATAASSSRPQARRDSGGPSAQSSSTPSHTSKENSSTKNKNDNSRKSNPNPPSTANVAEPVLPQRQFQGVKARLAEALLGVTAQPAAPPDPPRSFRKGATSSLSNSQQQQQTRPPPKPPAQRKRINSQPQQYDSRGRPVRPEQLREEEDEFEAYGGRGEDDIVLSAGSPTEQVMDDSESRKDLEVLARLTQKRNATPAEESERDRQVWEKLHRRRDTDHRSVIGPAEFDDRSRNSTWRGIDREDRNHRSVSTDFNISYSALFPSIDDIGSCPNSEDDHGLRSAIHLNAGVTIATESESVLVLRDAETRQGRP
ncbi:uncharacterized protein JCM6883_002444 [Sporobolomyces salmoneus]|uniref:uncharacterized protein n=1 Tax=Sporobolomyces salmoneus TaxID=183962 RepID=UPI00318004CA